MSKEKNIEVNKWIKVMIIDTLKLNGEKAIFSPSKTPKQHGH